MSKLSSAPHLVKNDEVNVRVEMIQSLIPIALEAVADLLSHELDELAGSQICAQGLQCSPLGSSRRLSLPGRSEDPDLRTSCA
jgi:hypothetical protein